MPVSEVICDERFLSVRFEGPQRVLSWAIVGGGLRTAPGVSWHYVSRAELPWEVDPVALLRQRLEERGWGDDVGLLTARRLGSFVDYATGEGETGEGNLRARAIATVGLSNALRTGDPPASERVGTINLLLSLSESLSDLALIEALALAVEARTAALMEAKVPSSVSARLASGTGTDCVVVSAPEGPIVHKYAGKHTKLGYRIGLAVEEAVRRATRDWIQERL